MFGLCVAFATGGTAGRAFWRRGWGSVSRRFFWARAAIMMLRGGGCLVFFDRDVSMKVMGGMFCFKLVDCDLKGFYDCLFCGAALKVAQEVFESFRGSRGWRWWQAGRG